MTSISGIRGIFGTDLTPDNLTRFTESYGHTIGGGRIVVGRDTRVTGKICEDIVCATLQSVGCDVIKAGVIPTPTVEMGVLKHEANGGIIISASHNPAEWNALKLLNERGEFLDEKRGQQVLERAASDSQLYVGYDQIGSEMEDPTLLDHHIQKILDLPYIDPERIRQAEFSVAVDAVNGTGGIAVPALLRRLGVQQVHRMNCEPTGLFAHEPEPKAGNLDQLSEWMSDHDYDLGVVTDPDADRLALVTETGTLFGEEYTQAAAFDFMMEKKPGPGATNLSSSRVVDDIASRHQQVCHRSAVGEINVVNLMKQQEAVIGGEGNGGVINPDLHYGRDALVGIAMILQLLAERDLTASEYRSQLPDYTIVKNKIELSDVDGDALLARAQKQYESYNPNTVDGVKIDFDEGWVHLRKSNTEPIIRVYTESTSESKAEELAENVMRSLK